MDLLNRPSGFASASDAVGDASFLGWLIQSAHDAIICQSIDGVVVAWNSAATALFGFTAAEMTGSDLQRLMPPCLGSSADPVLQRAQAGHAADEIETVRLHRDGRQIPVALRYSPVRRPDGDVVGWSIVARSRKTRQPARRQARQYRDIVIHASDAILVIDAQQTIRDANPAAQRLFGAGPAGLTGKPLDLLIPSACRLGQQAQAHLDAMEGSAPRQMDIAVNTVLARHLSGEMMPVELTLSRFGSGKDARMTAHVRDGRPRLEAERRRLAARKAAPANQAQSQLLARLSHELRTPASVVIGFANLLARDQNHPGGRDRELLQHILGASNHLLILLDDLLETARVENGSLRLEVAPQPLRQVLSDLLAQLGPLASASAVALSVDAGGPSAPAVMADAPRLRQVLCNLLTKAIKSTRAAGRVLLVLREQPDHICIDIRSTGPGMDAQLLGKLLEPYQRLGLEDTDIPGLGLGLSVARELVRRMQGHLRVSCTPGEGPTVTLQLRKARGNRPAGATDPSAEPVRALADGLVASQGMTDLGMPIPAMADPRDKQPWAVPT